MIEPSSTRAIKQTIKIGDQVAFNAGERVTIEQISPNPQRPEYQYVVFSRWMNQRFQLRDVDFVAPVAAKKPKQEPEKVSGKQALAYLFGFALLVTATVLGAVWWGWIGAIVGFVAMGIMVGSYSLMTDISDAGKAARKQLREKDES